MKKIAKVVVGITMAAAVAATAGAIAGCGSSDKTGEAYGLTHTGGYVGYSKIVVSGEKVKDLVLTEVCLPTHVKATNDTTATADEKVGNYYKTVSYANVTLTYDETDGYKTADGTKFVEYLRASEDNCKAYYEAVTSNSIKVTVGGQQKTDIMNYNSLSKEENNYWGRKQNDDGTWSTNTTNPDYSRWKLNRDATVAYVKANGVAHLTQLTQPVDSDGKKVTNGTDTKENKEVTYWMDGEISTGATWSDLNPASPDGYISYAQLILKANEAAK
ncbi:MAG: hypothetical protein ACI4QN_04840 [Candidatus Coproplasma sp.]